MYRPPNYPQYPQPYPPQPPQPPRGHPVPTIAFVATGLLIAALISCAFLGVSSLLDRSPGATASHPPTAGATSAATTPPPLSQQQQDLQLLASQAPDDTITLSLNAVTNAITVTDNIGEQLSVSAAVFTCKARAYYLLRALFTQASPTPSRVTLRILGPASDAEGNTDPNSLYATITLTAATAARITWPGLSFDAAWHAYDSAQLAPGLAAG